MKCIFASEWTLFEGFFGEINWPLKQLNSSVEDQNVVYSTKNIYLFFCPKPPNSFLSSNYRTFNNELFYSFTESTSRKISQLFIAFNICLVRSVNFERIQKTVRAERFVGYSSRKFSQRNCSSFWKALVQECGKS